MLWIRIGAYDNRKVDGKHHGNPKDDAIVRLNIEAELMVTSVSNRLGLGMLKFQ